MKALSQKVLLLLILSLSLVVNTFAQEDKVIAETVVHLLSYVAMDYPGAVKNGEIIDEMEFQEQLEFSAEAYNLTLESSFLSSEHKEKILSEMQELIRIVELKSHESEISKLANRINQEIIKQTGIETAPKVWPSITNGKELYANSCASCHGSMGRGDGPAGVGLDPSPSDFYDADLMDNFSAYMAYNSIRFGITGTAMVGYSNFNETELWDLAFYIKSLREQEEEVDLLRLETLFYEILPEIGLANVAQLTDKELLDSLKQISTSSPEENLKALRLVEPTGEEAGNSLGTAKSGLEKSLEKYREGNKKIARTEAIRAYLEGIEPVEARLRSIDSRFVVALETQMFQVRQAIEKDYEIEVLEAEIVKANLLIDEADEMLKSQNLNYWLTFILAFSIVLREALEAFLIIAVVIALIRSANVTKALAWVHGGWITAVLCGFAGWFLSDYIIQFGGKNREIMEGMISLFAVIVLVFAGFWLHNKTYAKKWTEFVEDKIGVYLNKDRMFGLAAFAFMIVFREAFEVVLFLQAIKHEAGAQNISAIGFGTLAAFVAIAIIAFVFLKYTKNLPIKQIFQYSSYLIILLAVILMGRGIHSLQESGWISVSYIPSIFRAEWLGIYPTIETILAQIGLITVIIVAYFINKKKYQDANVKA